MEWIIIVAASLLVLGSAFLLMSDKTYSYQFEERTVKARYLEDARRKLDDYYSPLIETNDPCIL